VDLDALARLLIEEKLPLAEAKRIDLGMVRSEQAAVRGDVNALRIMLRNLIDNAIRYTLEGGRVDVAVAREAACVILEVSDTGPGIPSERSRLIIPPLGSRQPARRVTRQACVRCIQTRLRLAFPLSHPDTRKTPTRKL
jgi:K+-sensing histidine kinase KdpD